MILLYLSCILRPLIARAEIFKSLIMTYLKLNIRIALSVNSLYINITWHYLCTVWITIICLIYEENPWRVPTKIIRCCQSLNDSKKQEAREQCLSQACHEKKENLVDLLLDCNRDAALNLDVKSTTSDERSAVDLVKKSGLNCYRLLSAVHLNTSRASTLQAGSDDDHSRLEHYWSG